MSDEPYIVGIDLAQGDNTDRHAIVLMRIEVAPDGTRRAILVEVL